MRKPRPEHLKLFGLSLGTALLLAGALYLVFMPAAERIKINAYTGNTDAQYELARNLADGTGMPEDDKAAVSWFRKAAERGNVKACMTMARLYFTGQGVEKDDAQGASWLQKAAEGGDSFAQAMMGLLYVGGIGVEQSLDQALKWLAQSHELEADMMMQDLRRNMERIDNLPFEERDDALQTFYTRKKLYTAELFARLVNKMKQQENKGDEEDEY